MDIRSVALDQRGAVMILGAFLIIPMIAFAGGAVDLVRMSLIENRMQAGIDKAVLAAASLNNEQEINTVINEYLAINVGGDLEFVNDLDITIDVDIQDNSRTVEAVAAGTIDNFFLGVIGLDTLNVNVASTAAQSIQNIEVSLVLDVSSSMRNNRIANLKTATKGFLDKILGEGDENITTINLIPYGGTVNIGPLFATYATSLDDAVVDPTESQYTSSNIAEDGFRFSDGLNCIEYADDDFDDAVLPINSRSQVPHFWEFVDFNPWCPDGDSAVLLNSNQLEILKSAVDAMSLSDGTGTDIGMLWGYKALSPQWQGLLGGTKPDRPALFDDEDTLKVLILMSDGGTTSQNRPEDVSLNSVHTSGKNKQNRQIIVNRNSARNNLSSLCDQAKDNDIIVFSIGFQINPGSFQEEDLQGCASSLGTYFLVETLDIDSAFASIAATIGALRLTQ